MSHKASLETLRAAIQIGKDQITRGECDIYTPSLLEKITRKTYVNTAKGKKIKVGVLPFEELEKSHSALIQ